MLNFFVDVSDPDIELPNMIHLYESAEVCRKDGQPEWFQFITLYNVTPNTLILISKKSGIGGRRLRCIAAENEKVLIRLRRELPEPGARNLPAGPAARTTLHQG